MATQLDAFEATLEAVQTTVSRTTPAAFDDALTAVLAEPAVGASLPFESVSLEGTGVVREPTPTQLREAACGVTAAALGVADYGSVVLESTPDGAELAGLFPEKHVIVLRERDIVPDMAAAFSFLGERFREGQTGAVIATGPSATADMGDLVYGAHGPRETHVIVLEANGDEESDGGTGERDATSETTDDGDETHGE